MEALEAIKGKSPSMEALRSYLPKVAKSVAPVLITGETGTGKERVAEAIHRLSRRKVRPFVAVNCAALPETLVESELFGHERGAFTGAVSRYEGRAAQAHQGTLFLDEIGEMSLYSQAKLLRFLESGSIDRVGHSRGLKVDVRVIAATNQALEDIVAEGRFRSDLYYRLNVARVEIDPLRERSDDIAILMKTFINELNERDGRRVGMPDRELLDLLKAYHWPGNVRELRNMVEAIFIDPPEHHLSTASLPPAFRRLIAGHRIHVPDEREALIAALDRTQWNKTEAAKLLKTSRMNVYRKIAKYHISKSPIDVR